MIFLSSIGPMNFHRRKNFGYHLDKKIISRLRIYFVISILLFGAILFEILSGKLSLSLALAGLVPGVVVGVIVSRRYLHSWDEDAGKVVSRLDIAGSVIFALYIIFALFREKIISHFVQGNYIVGASISVALGIMIGRIFGTGRKIISILKEQGLF